MLKHGIYLITTPIGNSKDITQRALDVLSAANVIYCEDTRNFRKLASILGIRLTEKQILSLHDHSDESLFFKAVELATENICAFVSDAGSPLISDPALPLIKAAKDKDIYLTSIGGVSSVITALELSGLPASPFHFHGFLARDNSKKNDQWNTIENQYGTHVLFEGVSRVIKTLEVMADRFPEYQFAVARELTKEFETIYNFQGKNFKNMRSEIMTKGEFVILIYNPEKNPYTSQDITHLANEILDKGSKPKLIAKLLSEITGINSKEIYKKLS